MVQWINILQNNISINLMSLLNLPYKNSGAIHIPQPGLMTDWLARWLAYKQDMDVNFIF